jgi:TetR/AcrR family transcriptional regulator, regulator of cefoperazone and chloramphenicol sensitivity
MKAHQAWNEGTKKSLVEAAGEVFAQHGFRATTIREVCKRANTGVSAVNYHFRDKKGLYAAVFEFSHRWATEKYPFDWEIGSGATPEERLRAFIRSFLLRGLGDGFPSWHGKLMTQEMANPSGVLSKVMKTAIRPMDDYLEGIVRELLLKVNPSRKADDATVRLCRMIIVGQCVFQFHSRELKQFSTPKILTLAQITAIADQIYLFSIGGLRVIAVEERS